MTPPDGIEADGVQDGIGADGAGDAVVATADAVAANTAGSGLHPRP